MISGVKDEALDVDLNGNGAGQPLEQAKACSPEVTRLQAFDDRHGCAGLCSTAEYSKSAFLGRGASRLLGIQEKSDREDVEAGSSKWEDGDEGAGGRPFTAL